MPNLLIGTSYAISAGLIIYSIQAKYAPEGWAFGLLFAWAIFGVGLSALAIFKAAPKEKKEE
jgi:uncharacterized membrane protein YbhN (UPF0104 family)